MKAPRVDLWLAWPETLADARAVAYMERLLGEAERTRYDRIRRPSTRQEYLVGRGLVRSCLSHYAPVEPAAWRFEDNAWGKPFVHPDLGLPDLRFNLSHTRKLVACAVTTGREVGVDVEDAKRRSRTVEIADRFFAADEVAQLHALPEADQRDRFFDWWTLKESWIKGVGRGLAIPLSKFAFDLRAPGAIRLTTKPDLPHDPAPWRFALFRPTDRHRLAVALDSPDATPEIRLRATDILGGQQNLTLPPERTG